MKVQRQLSSSQCDYVSSSTCPLSTPLLLPIACESLWAFRSFQVHEGTVDRAQVNVFGSNRSTSTALSCAAVVQMLFLNFHCPRLFTVADAAVRAHTAAISFFPF